MTPAVDVLGAVENIMMPIKKTAPTTRYLVKCRGVMAIRVRARKRTTGIRKRTARNDAWTRETSITGVS